MRRRALFLAYAATVASALPRPRRATTLRALRVRGGGPVDGALDKVRDLTTTPAGSVAFVSIYMAMELCGLPSVPLAAAAGVAYPTKVALAVVLASSVTAACVAYYVGRTRLRPRLDKASRDRRLRAVAAAVRRGPRFCFSSNVDAGDLFNGDGAEIPHFSVLAGLPARHGRRGLAAKGATVALPRWCRRRGSASSLGRDDGRDGPAGLAPTRPAGKRCSSFFNTTS